MRRAPVHNRDDLTALVLGAARDVVQLRPFHHHLVYSSVSRWFTFELGVALEERLAGYGWTSLVACGGSGPLPDFDLLLVPRSAAASGLPIQGAWSPATVAIVVGEARLDQGEGRPRAFVERLTQTPEVAHRAGRPCAHWLGVLVSGEGRWSRPTRGAQPPEESAKRPMPPQVGGALVRLGAPLRCDIHYRSWTGKARVELFGLRDGSRSG